MEVGYLEAVVALVLLVVIGPVAQVVTLKVGFNGMRDDIKAIKEDVRKLVTSEAVHSQRLLSLESRIKKVEN